MSPRPRKASDEDIFAAAYRVMLRLGPAELTLAAIAAEAGLTAGALVQRFGSKRGLLLQLAEGAAASSGGFIDELRERHRSPIAALRAYGECMAQLAASPAALARNLAYLQIDLTDPDFRKHLTAQARATRAGIRSLLEAAVQAEELEPRTDTESLARTVEAVLAGSMMMWAHYREGRSARWMLDDLDAVLAPYIRRRRSKRRIRGRAKRDQRGRGGATRDPDSRDRAKRDPSSRDRARRDRGSRDKNAAAHGRAGGQS